MAEFSARDNYVGEDWESECSESAASSEAVLSSNNTGRMAFAVCRQVERDDVSKYSDFSLSAGVESNLSEVTGRHSDKSAYVTDRKKVFVSNINYRVSLLCFMPGNSNVW